MRGVRCTRQYDLTRARDGARVARGRAEWVYVDATTGQPTRCPDGWAEAFPRAGAPEDLAVRLGTDIEYRESIRRRIRSASSALFENPGGLRQLEAFLRQAVTAARAGAPPPPLGT